MIVLSTIETLARAPPLCRFAASRGRGVGREERAAHDVDRARIRQTHSAAPPSDGGRTMQGARKTMAKNVRNIGTDKTKALDLTLKAIEKQFGSGSIMSARGRGPVVEGSDVISTQSISARYRARYRRVSHVVESSRSTGLSRAGKTTLTLHAIALELSEAKEVSQHSSTPSTHSTSSTPRAPRRQHPRISSSAQPDTGEQALEIVDMLVRSNAVDLDRHRLRRSPDSTRRDRRARWETRHVGLQARLMSQALRKLTGSINKSKTAP